jgi:hypothetical protein
VSARFGARPRLIRAFVLAHGHEVLGLWFFCEEHSHCWRKDGGPPWATVMNAYFPPRAQDRLRRCLGCEHFA